MKITREITLLFYCLFFLLPSLLYANDRSHHYTFYPLGGSFHFKTDKKTNDGNLNYFAFSKTRHRGAWHFEQGVGTFIDTFHVRSFIAFSEVSHDDYQYGMITPLLNTHCAYKGRSHKHKKRSLQCAPVLKFRIGDDKGLILKLTPIPKVKGITNGQLTFEIGYRF